MHNHYPLAPEKLEISENMLSKYCSNIANEYGIKIDEVNKLVPNLGNKSKYVVHYKNLLLYLSLPTKKSFHHSGGIPVEFHWSHGKLLENDWNKWNLWNSPEILLEFQQLIILIPLKFHL